MTAMQMSVLSVISYAD